MRAIIATIALASFSSTAAAQERAAWERSNSYICRAEQTRLCTGRSATCELTQGTAVFYIDFANSVFRVFGSDRRFDERIVSRTFQPDRYLSAHEISLSGGGGRVVMFGRPSRTRPTMDPRIIPAVMVSTIPPGAGQDWTVATYFLQCQPG